MSLKIFFVDGTFVQFPGGDLVIAEMVTTWFQSAPADGVFTARLPDVGKETHIQKRNILRIEVPLA